MKATVTGCHRFCAHKRKGGKQPYMLYHTYIHMHTHVRTFHCLHSSNSVFKVTLNLLPKEHHKHEKHVALSLVFRSEMPTAQQFCQLSGDVSETEQEKKRLNSKVYVEKALSLT